MNYLAEPIVCWECDPERWRNLVFAPVIGIKCSRCNKYMDPLDQPRKPIFELGPSSIDRPLFEIMKELGYADPEELRRLRAEEDMIGKDPLLYGDGPGDHKDEA